MSPRPSEHDGLFYLERRSVDLGAFYLNISPSFMAKQARTDFDSIFHGTRQDLTLPQYLTLPQLRVFLGEPYLPTDARKPEARET